MATSDLLAELSKETFKPDSDGERKICKCVLKLLNDQSSDVQGLAVKWCVPQPARQPRRIALASSASLTAVRPAAAQPFAARAQGARAAGGGDHGAAGDAGAGRATSARARTTRE